MPCLELLLEVLHPEHPMGYEQRDADATLERPLLIAYYHNAVLMDYS